jgi:hypothetical protein
MMTPPRRLMELGSSPTASQAQKGESTRLRRPISATSPAGTWRVPAVRRTYCSPSCTTPRVEMTRRSCNETAKLSLITKAVQSAIRPARQVAGRMSFFLPERIATNAPAKVEMVRMARPMPSSPPPERPSPTITPTPPRATAMATQVRQASRSLRKTKAIKAARKGEEAPMKTTLATVVFRSAKMKPEKEIPRRQPAMMPALPVSLKRSGSFLGPCFQARNASMKTRKASER